MRSFDRRRLLLASALLAALMAAVGFHMMRRQRIAVVLAVVDITGSMNTRDMGHPRGSQSRLEAAKQSLVDLLHDLPCQSRFGLGVFTERISFLLIAPVEVCGNYDALERSIQNLDWRMAWEGDSYIAKGLYSAIDIAASLKSDVIFLTDGHEAPPLPFTGVPEFEGKPGAVRGLIVGVGGSEKTPIPKYDDDGREIGVYGESDVPQENRIGAAPKDAETREGYNARNAPFGALPAVGDEQLSSVKTDHLQDLSRRTGLAYAELQHTDALAPDLLTATEARVALVDTNMAFIPGLIALALLVALYGLPVMDAVLEAARRRWPGRSNFLLHRKGPLAHGH